MAIGIVSNEEFDNEVNDLSSPSVVIKEAEVIDINRGRGQGNKEVPESIRKIISEESINGASGKELREAFGISQSSISAYKSDATSLATRHRPDAGLAAHNKMVRDRLIKVSRRKLGLALRNITSEKVKGAKLGELAIVAKAMSSITSELEEKQPVNNGVINNVIVYRPRMKEEDDYHTLEVQD